MIILKLIEPILICTGLICGTYGNSSGGKLINALGLDNSPMGYIKRHIETNMIIADKINLHQCNYMINPILRLEEFGLTEENLKWKQNY